MNLPSTRHDPAPPPPEPWASVPGAAYVVDAAERGVLFLDALRQRGNAYAERLAADEPPLLLKFDHELVVDGRSLPRPCNYLLLHLLPPKDAPLRTEARPLVVVDPRAGHGPGIGGFKDDSEVGVAMRAGHPVYFVAFRPQPEDGQTLFDVMQAEAVFLETVAARHPACPTRPAVIGNCQAGWAMAMLASQRPELFGPLMLVGAPLSYWAGGSQLNPMRYSGGPLGGAWMASLAGDLGGDRFDGAALVENFEKLNPANTLWGRWYRLYANVDDEAARFLDFERWWGGFFRMTGVEFETIVENLFVGNRLADGTMRAGDSAAAPAIDLRNIASPVLVFASWGDNITPPPQALDWIIDVWGSERAIAAAGRVIVYVLHETVGHLGIFVGGDVARKEHDQIVNSLDVIENLPPGLYEMKLRDKRGQALARWDDLEPGSYTVNYEFRTMDDLRAVNPEGRDEERLFSTVAQLSAHNSALYKTWLRPWVRALAQRPVSEALGQLHPLRLQRQGFSDAHPAAAAIATTAAKVRAQRHALAADAPARQWERGVSDQIESALEQFRGWRDQSLVQWSRLVFGPWGLGAWLPPAPPQEERAMARADGELAAARAELLGRVAEGGFNQAVCRIVLAGMQSTGAFERRSLRVARLLATLPPGPGEPAAAVVDWRALMHAEARIAAVAPVEALNALSEMLPGRDAREHALATAAAVMMIEPTLSNPRSEIIEWLVGSLGVDADRVIALARSLTAPLEHAPAATVATTVPAPRPRRRVSRPR